MHDAFGTVVWIVCGVAAVIALIALALSGRAWSEFGKSGLLMERDLPRGAPGGSAAAVGERDAEIREMLQARNARRVRRGEQPLDVEQELTRLTTPARQGGPGHDDRTPQVDPALPAPAPAVDPGLREEVRQLVLARNNRRVRAGKPPLDVDAELERELRRVSEF